jgi:hypothetical protein
LIFVVLGTTSTVVPGRLTRIEFWVPVVIGGIFSNLCFLLGPAIEAYGTWFQVWNSAFTALLFLAGLVLTVLLAILSIATL